MLKSLLKKVMIGAALITALLFAAIQLFPYGRDHTNPPVLAEPAWDSEQTRAFAIRSCYDCHSNETRWPWYSNIAPVSWLIQKDVDEGREKLNFSEWGRSESESGDMVETVLEGEMPPGIYTLLHPSAKLSSSELQSFIQGLEATFGSERRSGGREDGDDD